ncbi:unnamed protein product [Vitrella brassicaformis CCMP3155]|uniref:Uncharacterized protein n=3 Tax=Vitrella brassicaformis TaxID=1169539 RepID=A0A0G4GZD9_VITBC|nr:unnamed protein product [Vitrella brassicaformis CCMP3155]|eukprot:CEM36571.1 unnamed protein product [Vitrella brassicaformis CCMP3155]
MPSFWARLSSFYRQASHRARSAPRELRSAGLGILSLACTTCIAKAAFSTATAKKMASFWPIQMATMALLCCAIASLMHERRSLKRLGRELKKLTVGFYGALFVAQTLGCVGAPVMALLALVSADITAVVILALMDWPLELVVTYCFSQMNPHLLPPSLPPLSLKQVAGSGIVLLGALLVLCIYPWHPSVTPHMPYAPLLALSAAVARAISLAVLIYAAQMAEKPPTNKAGGRSSGSPRAGEGEGGGATSTNAGSGSAAGSASPEGPDYAYRTFTDSPVGGNNGEGNHRGNQVEQGSGEGEGGGGQVGIEAGAVGPSYPFMRLGRVEVVTRPLVLIMWAVIFIFAFGVVRFFRCLSSVRVMLGSVLIAIVMESKGHPALSNTLNNWVGWDIKQSHAYDTLWVIGAAVTVAAGWATTGILQLDVHPAGGTAGYHIVTSMCFIVAAGGAWLYARGSKQSKGLLDEHDSTQLDTYLTEVVQRYTSSLIRGDLSTLIPAAHLLPPSISPTHQGATTSTTANDGEASAANGYGKPTPITPPPELAGAAKGFGKAAAVVSAPHWRLLRALREELGQDMTAETIKAHRLWYFSADNRQAGVGVGVGDAEPLSVSASSPLIPSLPAVGGLQFGRMAHIVRRVLDRWADMEGPPTRYKFQPTDLILAPPPFRPLPPSAVPSEWTVTWEEFAQATSLLMQSIAAMTQEAVRQGGHAWDRLRGSTSRAIQRVGGGRNFNINLNVNLGGLEGGERASGGRRRFRGVFVLRRNGQEGAGAGAGDAGEGGDQRTNGRTYRLPLLEDPLEVWGDIELEELGEGAHHVDQPFEPVIPPIADQQQYATTEEEGAALPPLTANLIPIKDKSPDAATTTERPKDSPAYRGLVHSPTAPARPSPAGSGTSTVQGADETNMPEQRERQVTAGLGGLSTRLPTDETQQLDDSNVREGSVEGLHLRIDGATREVPLRAQWQRMKREGATPEEEALMERLKEKCAAPDTARPFLEEAISALSYIERQAEREVEAVIQFFTDGGSHPHTSSQANNTPTDDRGDQPSPPPAPGSASDPPAITPPAATISSPIIDDEPRANSPTVGHHEPIVVNAPLAPYNSHNAPSFRSAFAGDGERGSGGGGEYYSDWDVDSVGTGADQVGGGDYIMYPSSSSRQFLSPGSHTMPLPDHDRDQQHQATPGGDTKKSRGSSEPRVTFGVTREQHYDSDAVVVRTGVEGIEPPLMLRVGTMAGALALWKEGLERERRAQGWIMGKTLLKGQRIVY